MSCTILYKVPKEGPIIRFREFRNAWGGAYFIWTKMCQAYLGISNVPFSDSEMPKLCALAKDPKVERHDRIVHAMTFDKVLIHKKDLVEMAECLEAFQAKHNNASNDRMVNHVPAFAQALRELNAQPDTEAVAWCQTSVCGDVWHVKNEDEGSEEESHRFFDLSRDLEAFGAWFLFDDHDIVGTTSKVVSS